MKKIILASAISTILVGCGGSDGGSSAPTKPPVQPPVSGEVILGIAEMFNYDYNTIELICSNPAEIKCTYDYDGNWWASIETVAPELDHNLLSLHKADGNEYTSFNGVSVFPVNEAWGDAESQYYVPVKYTISAEGSVIESISATTNPYVHEDNIYAHSANTDLYNVDLNPVMDILLNNDTELTVCLGENGMFGEVSYDLSSEQHKAFLKMILDKNEELYQGN
ncbi:hypothetical protein BI375_05860 [Vibrio rotiferianus]|uniref:DUF4377 domain-containing protein n=1 Tax=Vibrio rotiferianus TaxID=190895 RepID=A0ABX3D899_9VIBR|nr:hypothetical protein [Vibrio rotiferianus]OHY92983.1 hypothetical protein BI375_05860 [Vibrio rotiferianus]